LKNRHVASLLVASVAWGLVSGAQTPPTSPSPAVQQLLDQGLARQAAGAHGEAVDLFRRADKEAGGACVRCLAALLQAYEDLGAFLDVAATARRLLQLPLEKGDEMTANLSLGIALSRPEVKDVSALAEATAALRRVAELTKGTVPEPRFHLGVALIRQGDSNQGVEELKKYLDLGPSERLSLPPSPTWARRFIEDPTCATKPCIPDFALVTSEGTTLTRKDLAGQVTVFYFGGPTPDNRSGDSTLAGLEKMAARMKDSPVRAISIVEAPDAIRPEWSKRMIFARNADRSTPSLRALLGITGWPDTFVADHRGHIVYHQRGGWISVPKETAAAVQRALKALPKAAQK
jgi:hypothetical protein